ncbi:MAG: M15 family metallopeptidase [Clostridiales bacterium]|nr:M15 family metallopeptidase [Clostridiales bacterium]
MATMTAALLNRVILTRADLAHGSLILINRKHPFRREEAAVQAELSREAGPLLNRECAAQLLRLIAACRGRRTLLPVDGYRTHDQQQTLYLGSLRSNGSAYTERYVALPDCSEHQTGLAADMAKREPRIDPICPFFPDSGRCGAFRRLAADYGFIERYPAGKESITGVAHEPWHFRYVGVPHAHMMADNDLTLEEYLQLLTGFREGRPLHTPDGSALIYYVEASEDETWLELPSSGRCRISGDNSGGFIVTILL